MPKNAIVVGMPRSGTSLSTRIFVRKGYFVTEDEGNDLDPADEFNPFGYWQAQRLVDCNIEIFHAVGYEFKNSWLWDPISDEALARIRSLQPLPGHRAFVAEFNRRKPWVWKDPRLCLTLSYWWQMMTPEDTAVLLLERDADEIHRSFKRIGYVSPGPGSGERVARLTAQHLDAARLALESLEIPHLTLQHKRYFDDPAGVAGDIGEFFDIELIADDLDVRADLNHSSTGGKMVELIESLYLLLPRPARSLLKRLTPSRVVRAMAPEKKYVPEEGRGEQRDGPRGTLR
jgi:hypothetical protein